MDKKAIIDQIENNSHLFSLPQVMSKLLEIAKSDDYSSEDLAKIILKDPSLTSKILQLANSSFYNRGNKINSILQAIMIIGSNSVICLALTASILNPGRIDTRSGINSRDYFTYVLSVAAASESIATKIGYRSIEEASIAGLLHDIGIIYFLNYYPEEYKKVLKLRNEGKPLLEAENSVLGIDHCEVGFKLARSWNLPDNIVEAIHHHHNMSDLDGENTLSNIVRLGILLTFNEFSNPDPNLENQLINIDKVSKSLNLNSERISEITQAVISRTAEISKIIGVEINEPEELLSNANQQIWKSYLAIERLYKDRNRLNSLLIDREKEKATIEAKTESIATLSHYMNNAIMVISGQSQILRLIKKQGKIENSSDQLLVCTDRIDGSIRKIVAVLQELREISPKSYNKHFYKSKALDIDERIEARLKENANNSLA